jgi:prepilin-type N-terminal cleavage/methylation domain-containing protein
MQTDRINGFTLTELLIVIVISLALTSIAVTAAQPAQNRYAVRGARDGFVAMHARARAQAVEAGQTTILTLNFASDRATITRGGTTLETVEFDESLNVDMQGGGTTMKICLNSRGFGATSCNSFSSGTDIKFVQGEAAEKVRIYPLGQVIVQ